MLRPKDSAIDPSTRTITKIRNIVYKTFLFISFFNYLSSNAIVFPILYPKKYKKKTKATIFVTIRGFY
mgnify:CR=1 FL=1